MSISVSIIKNFLDIFLKIKNSVSELKKSDIFLKETSIAEVVEKCFAFEQLPQGKVKFTGILSNFTLTNNLPAYSPVKTVEVSQKGFHDVINPKTKILEKAKTIEFKTVALNVPSITHNVIELSDGSKGKILWLYNEQINGLLLPQTGKGLDPNNIQNVFDLNDTQRPFPVIVAPKFNYAEFLYKRVQITGTLITAPLKYFEELSGTSKFLINYLGNCFRPFSNTEGVLAIDLRDIGSSIEKLEKTVRPFPIIYTVQGMVMSPEDIFNEKEYPGAYKLCSNCIPDRQGMFEHFSTIGTSSHPVKSIVTIGEIDWQFNSESQVFAAFIEIDASDQYNYQTSIAQLSHHWEIWQKNSRKKIREVYNVEPKISPLICSNISNQTLFHPNGLQISRSLEMQMLSQNPELRRSIDWLGISTGKK